MRSPGRPATTGRYRTRAELEEWVRFFSRSQSDAQVARTTGVSESTVRKILAGPPPGR